MLAFGDFFVVANTRTRSVAASRVSRTNQDCLLSAFGIPLSLALNFEAAGLFISNYCGPRATNLSLTLGGKRNKSRAATWSIFL